MFFCGIIVLNCTFYTIYINKALFFCANRHAILKNSNKQINRINQKNKKVRLLISEFLNLNRILNLEKWQKLQNAIALATKMAIITVDFRGTPVTSHSFPHTFCQEIRKDPQFNLYCQKCDARGGLEAVRQNAPYIYYCHFHIIDIAIPITIDEKYLGAIMIGQIKLDSKEKNINLEQILAVSNTSYQKKIMQLQEKYDSLPILTFNEIKIVAEMVFHLSNYIVEEALNKNLTLEMYQQALHQETPSVPSGYTAKNIEDTKNAITNTLLDSRLKSLSCNLISCHNPILKPIFSYINNHKSETISMKEAAELCHVSPSHFSRIFTKETGEHYSNFISHLKITWSKQLLTETEMSITQISEELGFNETGYFIKTFKKYENITPSIYRKYYKQ